MKTIAKIILGFVLFALPVILLAQPHPYDTNIGGGEGNFPAGGAAPISGGIIIMFSMGLGYAAKKVFDLRKKLNN